MTGEQGRQEAIAMLCCMQENLRAQGLSRLPQRSDFTPEQIVQIKAHLGPFPRALEAAGLKAPRDAEAHAAQCRQKRIAAKRRKLKSKIDGKDVST